MQIKKRVLLTGCSSGFGRLTAELLAQQGAIVFAGMRDVRGRNAVAADELRVWSRREGRTLTVLEMDVSDDASVNAAVQTIVDTQGHLDVLVNNAGVLC